MNRTLPSPGFDNGNTPFPQAILPNGILTLEALKKLTAGPLTVKMNRPVKSLTPVEPMTFNRTPVTTPRVISPRPEPDRPMDLSLLSTGFSSFLKKVEGQEAAGPGVTSPAKTIFPPSPVTSEEFCPNSVAVNSISPQKPLNRSLSEMERKQILEVPEIPTPHISDPTSQCSKRNRRKQGTNDNRKRDKNTRVLPSFP